MDQNNQEAASSTPDENLEREIAEALGGKSVDELMQEADAQEAAEQAAVAGAEAADGAATADAGTPANANAPASGGSGESISHQIKRGRIAVIRGEDVFVELAGIGKTQGVVPLSQFERAPRVGSIMDFVVSRFDESEGLYFLSREGAVQNANWNAMAKGIVVEARVTGSNKGGLELELAGSIKAFMPASQVDLHHVDDMDKFTGEKFKGIVTDIDRKAKQVVLSRRQYLERTREQERGKTMAALEVDQVREGKVSSVTDYGAFVDLGGVDGLIHVSDMSYSRVEKPSDVVTVGQTLMVKVLKIDTEKNRIGLGLKQIQADPWEDFLKTASAGDQVTGTATRTAPFGAFVKLAEGVEGLAPISELSWRRVARTEDVINVGDVKQFVIMDIDGSKQRLSLSLRQSGGDPWIGAEHNYAVGSLVEGTVLSTKEFGAFVELVQGVEGLVHISELAHKRVNSVEDILKVGETNQFRVLTVDEEDRRISLSLKAVTESPEQKESREASDYMKSALGGGKGGGKAKPSRKTGGAGGLGSSGALGTGLGDLKL